jgi:hypothetical protein
MGKFYRIILDLIITLKRMMMDTLNKLNGWAKTGDYKSRKSAQGYMNQNSAVLASSGCGSACGAKDGDAKPKPSACGAGDDDKKPQPSACGAGDDDKKKPAACGSSCGSEGK